MERERQQNDRTLANGEGESLLNDGSAVVVFLVCKVTPRPTAAVPIVNPYCSGRP